MAFVKISTFIRRLSPKLMLSARATNVQIEDWELGVEIGIGSTAMYAQQHNSGM
jgi:hypothetical protein